jgi:Fe-S cluster assembly protein SufD
MENVMTTINPSTGYKLPELTPELLRGPAWLRSQRISSRTAFNEAPLPQRGLHLWRYTDPTDFLFDRATVGDTAFGDDYDAVEKIALDNLAGGNLSGLVTDLGGRDIKFRGLDELARDGGIVTSLSEAVTERRALVEPYLYQLLHSLSGKFEALNGALWNDGIFVYVPPGKTVHKPLHLLREAGLGNSAQFPRLLVVVDRNAELTLIDEYGGGSGDRNKGTSYTNSAVEIFGLEDSRVRYVNLQRQAAAATTYLAHRARIDRGANMLTIFLTFGAALAKQSFGVILSGDGAESNIYGLSFGAAHQHFDCHTLQHHDAGRTRSYIDHKVVLRDKAQSAYTGLIRIDKMARGCEAYQENRNLLLNKGTKAETIPELEILNEDVHCSHGATLGPIDPMQVFYLKSRGIGQKEAVEMIVSGFVEPTLQRLPTDLRERIGAYVAQRLENI